METFTVNQAQAQFDDLLLKVQHNPIAISRSGNPVAVMISMADSSVLEALKLQSLQQIITHTE